jgi:CDP-glycerol glycerophosphotransferase (TagB/SpsB family)
VDLRFTFRRTVNSILMNRWYELEQIASSINITDEPDSVIWQLNSTGHYSVQSLYTVVNDRGVRQVFTPVV